MAAEPPLPPETRSTTRPSDDTNRNASIVASVSGRARWGLQVKIFRSIVILKVLEEGGRVGDEAAAVEGLLLQRLLGVGGHVVEEFVDVERVEDRRTVVGRRGERERRGVVTSQMIVFKIEGVGGREKGALKDIAICVKGR
jgi:hypothetical protein